MDRGSLFVLLFGCAMLWANPGAAEGAVATGVPSDVGKQGVALGYSYGAPTTERAKEVALDKCRTSASPVSTRALCKLVENFKDRCVALVLDPKVGTPGFGWGIGLDKKAAEKAALQMCSGNAGAGRREHCEVTNVDCDGPQNKGAQVQLGRPVAHGSHFSLLHPKHKNSAFRAL
jgi:hypothetical protein